MMELKWPKPKGHQLIEERYMCMTIDESNYNISGVLTNPVVKN